MPHFRCDFGAVAASAGAVGVLRALDEKAGSVDRYAASLRRCPLATTDRAGEEATAP